MEHQAENRERHRRNRIVMEAEMLLVTMQIKKIVKMQQINPMQKQHQITAVMQRTQNLTVKIQSPIQRIVKRMIQQITENPRKNQMVTIQMEMVEHRKKIRGKHLPCWI